MSEHKPKAGESLNAAAKLARVIEQADIIHIENPDDLNDDGIVVGKAAQMNEDEKAATLSGVTEVFLENAMQGEEGLRYADFFSDDLITAQLRAEMITLCVDLLKDIPEDEAAAIRDNIVKRERIENIREWLDGGGWSEAEKRMREIGQELEKCYEGVPEDIVTMDSRFHVQHLMRMAGKKEVERIEIFHNDDNAGDRPAIHRLVRLAGKKSAPIKRQPSVEVTGEPLEYLAALRWCFDAKEWLILLKTTPDGLEDIFSGSGLSGPVFAPRVGVPDQFKWLRLLVQPYLENQLQRIRLAVEFRQTATPLSTHRAIVVGDRSWSRLPKVAVGMSWAFGGSFVELDGRQFMPASDLPISRESGRYVVPAGYSLLPREYTKPHQMILPLDLTGDDSAPPLPMAIASAGQYAMSFQASLMGIDIMGVAMSQDFAPAKTSMRELAKRINPDTPKLKRSHYETIAKGLGQLNNTHIVLPDGRSYRLFDTMVPWREFTPEQYDMEFSVGFSQSFVSDVLRNIEGSAGSPYKGYFIVDRTGIMKCSGASVLRSYLRACAYWNAHFQKLKGRVEPAPQLMRPVPMEHWVMLTNLLTPAAEEYIQSGKRSGGGRNRKHEAVKAAKEAAQELEGHEMAKIKVCNSKEILLHPTEMHIEAWKAARNAQDKMGR